MSTNAEEIRVQEFALQCMTALRRIKESLPKTWKATLAPYQMEIRETAIANKTSESAALDLILDRLKKEIPSREKLKTSYTFYMAAYCTML